MSRGFGVKLLSSKIVRLVGNKTCHHDMDTEASNIVVLSQYAAYIKSTRYKSEYLLV